MQTRREFLKLTSALVGGVLAARYVTPAFGQSDFPAHLVRVTTPFPVGAGPDTALRLVCEQLSQKWGHPVIVDNKPGGNGFVAVAAFKKGSPDAYNLLQLDSQHCTTHPHMFSKPPYDMEHDFTPLRMILRTPFFVAVSASSPYKTVDDLVAAARKRPGEVKYGSWFVGSPGHIGALLLQSTAGVEMTHVPYRDFGQLYTAVANNDVDWALGSVASAGGFEQGGKLRFIAVAAPRRDPLYPNVPATAELAHLTAFQISGWTGIFAPKGIGDALRDRLSRDMADALAAANVVERYRVLGLEAPPLDAVGFAELIRRETIAWSDLIHKVGLKLDA